jgi:glycolate oxidase FAD binding subunit
LDIPKTLLSNCVYAPPAKIDGLGSYPLLCPGTVAELGEWVRRIRTQRQAIYPVGGRTHQSMGLPASRPGIALETLALNQVVDYPSRDLTITVQAGIRIRELQAILAKENQRLAVDVSRADSATLGGALAVNASGPRRFGCGTLRDYLIGVSFVNDNGDEIKSGGRVVKNVAGYDMCKLLVGSLGTLGIITQATLKLRPLPEAQALVMVSAKSEKISPLLDLVHASRTRPCCVELLNPLAAGATDNFTLSSGWVVVVGFEDNQQTVEWQVQTLQQELSAGAFPQPETVIGPACDALWKTLTEFAVEPYPVFRVRASVPPESLGELCGLLPAGEKPWHVQAHAGNGILRVQGNAEIGEAGCRQLFSSIKEFAVNHGGNVIVEDCPVDWKTGMEIWGHPREDFWLMRQIKNKLDPDSIFNPGRFVDGI